MRHRFPFAIVLLATVAAVLASSGARAGADEILILPGTPDLAIVAGDTLAAAAAGSAFRWTGVDLQWAGSSVQGRCIRLLAAVSPGRYEVRVDLAMIEDRPCAIEMTVVAPSAPLDGTSIAMIPLAPGDRRQLAARIAIPDGPLDLFVKPVVGCRIALSAVHIAPLDGTAPLQLGSLPARDADASSPSGGARRDENPERPIDPNDLLRTPVTAPTETRACLRETCEYLLRYQLSTGLFDLESAAWWKASICVRTLLAGYELFRDPRYLAAAQRTLDAFVAEQDPDGGWCGFCRAQQPDAPCDRRNIADLGSMTACLSMIGWLLQEEPLTKPFTDAHERYLKNFASKHAGANGSYRNGVYEGRDWEFPYSVATATQAMSLTTSYRAIPDTTVLRQAEKAAWFLLMDWDTNGQPGFHSHDVGEPVRLRATEVHDIYYMLESVLFVARVTKDPVLLDAIRMTLRNYVLGERGLLKELAGDWFSPSADPATLAKSCGMLAILIEARDMIGSGSAARPHDRARDGSSLFALEQGVLPSSGGAVREAGRSGHHLHGLRGSLVRRGDAPRLRLRERSAIEKRPSAAGYAAFFLPHQ